MKILDATNSSLQLQSGNSAVRQRCGAVAVLGYGLCEYYRDAFECSLPDFFPRLSAMSRRLEIDSDFCASFFTRFTRAVFLLSADAFWIYDDSRLEELREAHGHLEAQ